MCGGLMFVSIGNQWSDNGDLTVPLIILIILLSWISTFFTCELSYYVWNPYSAVLETRPKSAILNILASAPQPVSGSICTKLIRDRIFLFKLFRCSINVSVWSSVISKYIVYSTSTKLSFNITIILIRLFFVHHTYSAHFILLLLRKL